MRTHWHIGAADGNVHARDELNACPVGFLTVGMTGVAIGLINGLTFSALELSDFASSFLLHPELAARYR